MRRQNTVPTGVVGTELRDLQTYGLLKGLDVVFLPTFSTYRHFLLVSYSRRWSGFAIHDLNRSGFVIHETGPWFWQ